MRGILSDVVERGVLPLGCNRNKSGCILPPIM